MAENSSHDLPHSCTFLCRTQPPLSLLDLALASWDRLLLATVSAAFGCGTKGAKFWLGPKQGPLPPAPLRQKGRVAGRWPAAVLTCCSPRRSCEPSVHLSAANGTARFPGALETQSWLLKPAKPLCFGQGQPVIREAWELHCAQPRRGTGGAVGELQRGVQGAARTGYFWRCPADLGQAFEGVSADPEPRPLWREAEGGRERRREGREAAREVPAALPPSLAPGPATAPPASDGAARARGAGAITARQGAEPPAHLNTPAAHLHVARMAVPGIGRLRGSPQLPAPAPAEGAGPAAGGEGTRAHLHNGRRVRRGEATRALGAGSEFEPAAADSRRAGGSGGGRRGRRQELPRVPGCRYGRSPRCLRGAARAVGPRQQRRARSAAPRGGGGGGSGSAHALGLQLCTRAAARTDTRSRAQRSQARAAWEHVTGLQCSGGAHAR